MNSTLARITIAGYRSLRSIELAELGPRTVLIGPNGAGKSNLLSFLRLVASAARGGLGTFVGEQGGAQMLLHYGAKVTPRLDFELAFTADGTCGLYHATLGHAAGDRFVYLDERIGEGTGDAIRWQSLGAGHFESRLTDATDASALTVSTALRGLGFYHLHDTSPASPMRANARAADARVLRGDGGNLAAVLAALARSDEPADKAAFHRIEGLVRQIAPFIRALEPGDIGRHAIRLFWRDTRDEVFGPEHLSDGTLRAIGLFTALGQPIDRLPGTIAIDEPELGLHPAALHLFCELVHGVSTQRQLLIATQSPALLDHFEPADVRVVEHHDGASTIRRLDSATLAAWLDDYKLSELFDSNLLGGRP